MLTTYRVVSIGAAAVGVALGVAGCASVDTKNDFGQTSRHVSAAIGVDASSLSAGHQERDAALPSGMSADDAVRICLLNNPRIQTALLSIGIARADVVQSSLFHNPGLSLSVRFPDGGGLADVEVGLAQNLADLWLIPVRKRAAETELRQRILDVAREVSVIALEARSAYYRAASADRERAIAEENRDVARQLFELAEARQTAGVGNQIDVNLARAGVLDIELELRGASLAAYQARRELAAVMGVDWRPDDLQLSEALPAPRGWNLTDERLIDLAKSSRLDLLAARQNVDVAAARLVQERRSVFGDVEVGIDMERSARPSGSDDNLLYETARESLRAGQPTLPELFRHEDEGQDVIVGPTLSLALPIFDQNQAQIAKAEFAHQQAVVALRALELEISQAARGAHARARAAWDVFALYRNDLVPLLQENLELSREAYRAGKVSFLSVLQTQQALLRNRAKYVEAQRDSAQAVVELEKAVGKPMSEILANEMESHQPRGDDGGSSVGSG